MCADQASWWDKDKSLPSEKSTFVGLVDVVAPDKPHTDDLGEMARKAALLEKPVTVSAEFRGSKADTLGADSSMEELNKFFDSPVGKMASAVESLLSYFPSFKETINEWADATTKKIDDARRQNAPKPKPALRPDYRE